MAVPFDPSVISQIPDFAPNPMAAKAQGFKLADLINTEQLDRLRVNQVKTEQEDQLKMKEILKNEDLSTPQGISKAAQALTKAGLAEQGMKLMGTAQQYQTGAIEQERNKLQLASQQADILAGALDNVYGQLEQFRTSNPKLATPEMLDMMAAKIAGPEMKALSQQYPELKQYIDRFGQNPQNLTYAGIKSAEAATNRGQAMLKERLAEAGLGEKERHDRALEAASVRRQAGEGQKVETVVDPKTRIPRRILFDSQGNVVKDLGEAPAGRGEHPTEAENKAAVNYTTMKNAEDVLESPKYKNMNMAFLSTVEEDEHGYLHAIGRFGRKAALTPEQQVIAQAARQFAEGAGHLKSGARINQATMQLMVDLYLPLPGDSPELKSRKRAARRNDLVAGRVGAGRAAENIDKAEKTEAAKRGADDEIPQAPAVGTVEGGYRYKGGDPGKKESWEKVGG